MIKWIVHDVLQQGGITIMQHGQGVKNQGDLFKSFKSAMRQFEGTETTLLCLAEGVKDVPWVKYIKNHPEWKVQCHGMRHARYDQMSAEQMYRELWEAKQILERTFGVLITEFYCPYNKYSETTKLVAAQCNMEEVRNFRRPTHYKHNWRTCRRVDFHCWNTRDMRWVRFIRNLLEPQHIFIVGAPRSGTTAYMRWLRDETPGSMALKEREHIWREGFDREYYYAHKLADNALDILIDKNCRNSMRLPQIMTEFPNAKVHHVIRDGRAVALSWMKWAAKTKKSDQTLKGAAKQWVDYVNFIREHLPEDAIELRYEDLCDRYEYFTNRNFKWHKELTYFQKRQVEKIQGPWLEALGYL
jgi:peptidoglycan/xylan/chitin deacetylase (PgdA/CDA1 family)